MSDKPKLTINVPGVPVPLVIDNPDGPFAILSSVGPPVLVNVHTQADLEKVRADIAALAPQPVELIDPKSPPRRKHAPPMDVQYVDVFSACHLLAYGTDYLLHDYSVEADKRHRRDEEIDWGWERLTDAATQRYYREKLRDAFEGGAFNDDAIHLYLDARGLAVKLRHAAQVLQEAAARGEVEVLGRRFSANTSSPQSLDLNLMQLVERFEARSRGNTGSPQSLDRMEFVDRTWLSFTSGQLMSRDHRSTTPDFVDLRFNRDQVLDLLKADWHTLSHSAPVNDGPASHGFDPRSDGDVLSALAEMKAKGATTPAVRTVAGILAKRSGIAANKFALLRDSYRKKLKKERLDALWTKIP